MKRALSVLFLCLLVQPAFSADKWLSVRTKNFQLVGNAGESGIRRVGRYLEEFRSAFAMMFPKADQTSSAPTTIMIFKDDASFTPYKPVRDGKPVSAVAYFQPGEDVNYIAVSENMSSPAVIFHEYVHFLTREGAGGLPIWAREGLAEFYGTFEMKGNEFTLGRTPAMHIQTLTERAFLPLKTLFAVDYGSPHYNEESKQGVFYAESWALTHYLMMGADGKRRSQFTEFLTALGRGEPVDDSFADTFQTDYSTIEDELRDYIRKRKSWPLMKVTSRESLQVDARSIKTATLSEAESEYYLGDLLLHINRLGEAETHLKNALARDPNLIPAQASFGILRVRQRNYEEALTVLKKAVEADSKNAITNYYYAYVLERFENENTGAADFTSRYELLRTYAKKSIELAPRFVEAYALLGRASLLAGENLDESETMLKKAATVAPGRHDLYLLLAQTYLRADKTADARAVLMNIERVASDPEIRKRTTALLDQTEQGQSVFTEILPDVETRQPEREQPSQTTDIRLPAATAPNQRETKLEALTPVGPDVEGEKVTGLLILLECANGLTLRIRGDRGTLDLHSSAPESIQFLSYTSTVTDNIACGPRNPGTPVTVTYRLVPGRLGEPLVVEFIEKK